MISYLDKAPALSEERKGELFSFTESLGLKFNDYRLLNLAFTHTSFANECKGEVDNNERLEFLGDSILGMITAEYLFSSFTRFHEGQFSKIKAVVVSEQSLSEVALAFHFDKYILVGRGERSQKGTMKKAILADALEAVIASLYLDQGLETAKRFVLSFIPDQVEKMLDNKLSYKDYKTELQEYLQKRRGKVPRYVIVSQTGPDHAQIFRVNVEMGTKVFGPGEGRNKKAAEQDAAHMALIALGIERA